MAIFRFICWIKGRHDFWDIHRYPWNVSMGLPRYMAFKCTICGKIENK